MSIYESIEAGIYKNPNPYPADIKDPKARKVKLILYYQKEAECKEMFKKDALEDLGLSNHPKADKLFDIAWERGHASGYQSVWSVMIDLAPLLQD